VIGKGNLLQDNQLKPYDVQTVVQRLSPNCCPPSLISLPMRAIFFSSIREQRRFMSIKTRTNRTNRIKKQTGNGVNRLQTLEGTLLGYQVSEAAGKKAATKRTSIEGQRNETLSPTEPMTVVQAKIDVGFGNSIFIRGQGAGLSWDKGLPLTCIEGSAWVWSTRQA
jgi:hypothetical protein